MFNISHFCISVSNIERSLNFYKKLGFEIEREYFEEDKSVIIYFLKMSGSNTLLELVNLNDCEPMISSKYDLKKIGTQHLALITDDIEEARRLFIEEIGIKEATEIELSKLDRNHFFVKDPDGITLEIVENTK